MMNKKIVLSVLALLSVAGYAAPSGATGVGNGVEPRVVLNDGASLPILIGEHRKIELGKPIYDILIRDERVLDVVVDRAKDKEFVMYGTAPGQTKVEVTFTDKSTLQFTVVVEYRY